MSTWIVRLNCCLVVFIPTIGQSVWSLHVCSEHTRLISKDQRHQKNHIKPLAQRRPWHWLNCLKWITSLVGGPAWAKCSLYKWWSMLSFILRLCQGHLCHKWIARFCRHRRNNIWNLEDKDNTKVQYILHEWRLKFV